MLIPLLTEYEKEHIAERQPLPERYLGLSDEEMDRRIAAAQGDARPPARDPRPSLPARRSDQVRRLHRRLLQARRPGQPASRRRVHRLLRRALHGRERRRAERARTSRSSCPTSPPAARWPTWPRPISSRCAGPISSRWASLGAGGDRQSCSRSPTSTRPRRSKRSAASTAASSARRRTPRRR